MAAQSVGEFAVGFLNFAPDWLKSRRTHVDERVDRGEGRTSGRCSAGLVPGGGEEMRREESRGEERGTSVEGL